MYRYFYGIFDERALENIDDATCLETCDTIEDVVDAKKTWDGNSVVVELGGDRGARIMNRLSNF